MSLIGKLNAIASRERAQALIRYRQIISKGDDATDIEADELRQMAQYLNKTDRQIELEVNAAKQIKEYRAIVADLPRRELARQKADAHFEKRHTEIAEQIKVLKAEDAAIFMVAQNAQGEFQVANAARSKLPAHLQQYPDAGLPLDASAAEAEKTEVVAGA
jgi:hypothetical protein